MQMTGLAGILDQMEKSGTKINLLLLDACRNPFLARGVCSITGGLAQMQSSPGTLISFATQPRSVALDGDHGHSPYTRALADTCSGRASACSRRLTKSGSPWRDARRSIAVGVVVADLAEFLFRRQAAVAAAGPACDDAMQRYPDVMCFVFEAGRVAGARKDFAEARRLCDKAAAAGYPMAFNNIGALYEGGDGTRLDYAQAVNWYKKAVDLGEPIAMVDLGHQYENGHGVKKDCAEAVRLYETAVKAGIPAAMNNLGPLYQMRLPRLCRGAAPDGARQCARQ
jgi:hypothetical protein